MAISARSASATVVVRPAVADEARFQGEDVRARSFKGEAFAKDLAKAEQLRFLVHGDITSLTQAALAFCLADPAVSITIPGARNAAQMRENASAGDVEIPRADEVNPAGYRVGESRG